LERATRSVSITNWSSTELVV